MEQSNWAETVVDSIFDFIAITDKDGKIFDTNEAVTQLGYAEVEVINRSIYDLVINRADLEACYTNPANGKVDLRRMLLRCKNGDELWFDVFIRQVTIAGSELWAVVAHNVHDRALARQELEGQKAQIEQALRETEALRKQAEETGLKLEEANVQLQHRQANTEAQLAQEKEFRIQQNRFGIQQRLVGLIVGLILVGMVLPYVASAFAAVDQNISNSTGNALLLLIGGLTTAIGTIFGRRQEEKEGTAK